MRVVWVDASSGASGDMLLAALADVGVPVAVMAAAAASVAPVTITVGRETRHGFAVGRAYVSSGEADPPHRTWADVRDLLDAAALEPAVRRTAHRVFARLAHAEGEVHGVAADDVHFHEVGALDAIADVVGVSAGFAWLGARVVVGPVSLGGGTARAGHGEIPVPGPAVLRLLAGSDLVAVGGPVDVELCTPTGAALLAELADAVGPMPSMSVSTVGLGAGSRVLPDRAGALRLVLGTPQDVSPMASPMASPTGPPTPALVVETNVDDLDPRVWPHVLTRLMTAGASDAWLTPILMKKGRPAHTLQVLCDDEPAVLQRITDIVLRETSAIGLRTRQVGKVALPRVEQVVDLDGHPVRVKLAVLDGVVVNAQPEHDDVVAAAAALGLPVKVALARAAATASGWLGTTA